MLQIDPLEERSKAIVERVMENFRRDGELSPVALVEVQVGDELGLVIMGLNKLMQSAETKESAADLLKGIARKTDSEAIPIAIHVAFESWSYPGFTERTDVIEEEDTDRIQERYKNWLDAQCAKYGKDRKNWPGDICGEMLYILSEDRSMQVARIVKIDRQTRELSEPEVHSSLGGEWRVYGRFANFFEVAN